MIFPDDSQHHTIIGTNGSGKTHLAAHTLSQRLGTGLSWSVINFKDDELLNDIPHVVEISGMKLPKKTEPNTIYMFHADVNDWYGTENLVNDIYRRKEHGIVIDEALEMSQPKHPAYRRVLTQGRSKHVPVISATQRPVGLDRYAFSEAKFISVMELNDPRETDTIYDMTGILLNMSVLPKYHSYYIDRVNKKLTIVGPAPSYDDIIDTFDRKLRKTKPSHVI